MSISNKHNNIIQNYDNNSSLISNPEYSEDKDKIVKK